MDCSVCIKTKPILNCIDDLIIGTLGLTTFYYVYFKNSSNGRLFRTSATQTSGSGLLTIAIDFSPLTTSFYEVWVTLESSDNLDDREAILIDGIEASCLYVNFQRVFESSANSTITATTQTLTLA